MQSVAGALRILAVGSDSEWRRSIRDALGSDHPEGDLSVSETVAESTPLLEANAIDCVLVGWQGKQAFVRTVETLQQADATIPVVAVVADDRIDTASNAIDAGADEYVPAGVVVDYPEVALSRIRGVIEHGRPPRVDASDHWITERSASDDASTVPAAPEDCLAKAVFDAFPNGAVTLVNEQLTYLLAGGDLFDNLSSEPGDVIGSHVSDVGQGDRDVFVRAYTETLAGSQTATETTIGEMTLQLRTAPVRASDGSVIAAVGMTQDITERKRYERNLKRRERILQDLHVATRALYPPESPSEVWAFLVEFIEESFQFPYVSVKRFDEQAGVLRPGPKSVAFGDETDGPGVVEPGTGPLWEAYRVGERREIDISTVAGLANKPLSGVLAVPLGNYGLIVVGQRDGTIDAVDRDLIELVATNAKAVLDVLKQAEQRARLAGQLDAEQQSLHEMRTVVTAIQAIQKRLSEAESRDTIETAVCEELTGIETIDFAWVGHPQRSDSDLEPSAWAGHGTEYLDFALQETAGSLPARQATANREAYVVPRISERVHDDAWAKEALSAGFRSAMSAPLLSDGVLYGVLTVYLSVDGELDSVYRDLVEDVASLLVTYSRLLEQRHSGANQRYTALEFQLADTSYPLQRLAEQTGAHIRYDTVAEVDDESIRILVTVTDGDRQAVLQRATESPGMGEPQWFGDSDTGQLTLSVDRPFLADIIVKHGGTLCQAVSEPAGTRLSVAIPQSTSTRPLLEALTSHYTDIDLRAQHSEVQRPDDSKSLLTERQYEILNAAYHGGYYETPRSVTGEDLADTFDISGPAVSKHLQAAHRNVIGSFLDGGSNIRNDN
ncbi:bacterio-opsin activator domain-containing protein [Halorhabdus sp. CUG00001]|uniref:bacterio-opsin activator domain-containing protein n=1 Tax=Halorhabdus sp. CUG00001 TaxID=2600297 RepID=UPI00131AC2D2|nr:bacterio-opsin activator domain-containing protein [Halorhabdus sp. CUG00001]